MNKKWTPEPGAHKDPCVKSAAGYQPRYLNIILMTSC